MAQEIVYEKLLAPEASLKALANYQRLKDRTYVLAYYVPLIALLGLGAHFSKNALAPAQPVLEAMGLSPVLYAVVYDVPTVGAIIFPTLWGLVYERAERAVVLIVPLGLLFGQLVLVSGFILHDVRANEGEAVSTGCKLMMVSGLLLLSMFRAGAEVVQHTLLAKLMPSCTITGFVVLVFCTHAIVVICNIVVPRALVASDDAWRGVVLVQLIFLIPSVVGSCAACVLCALKLPDEMTDVVAEEEEPALRVVTPAQNNLSTTECAESCGSGRTNAFLMLWAGAIVGMLHAWQSVTSKFIVSRGYSVTAAGDVTARNQFVGLCIMPLFSKFDGLPKRALMVGMSAVTFVTALALMFETRTPLPDMVWQLALLAFAIVGVFAPVLSLSMIPEYLPEPGKAYGILDSWKSFAQAALVLIIGKCREEGGLQLATTFVMECFLVILVLAVCAAWKPPPKDLQRKRAEAGVRATGS